MIVKYNVETKDKIMIKEYLENLLPSALLTNINKQNIKYIVNDQLVHNYYLLSNNDVLQVIIPADIENENIIPINQDTPLDGTAYITVAIDVSELNCSIEKLKEDLSNINGVKSVDIMGVE